MNLVTIIIPMFNEIENIRQCVEALKNQKNQRFDVVFIDDGSTDGTTKYLEKILEEKLDFKYQILIQKNKGAAEARKMGLEISETDFIIVYDCDDKLSDDLVEEFYNIYKEYCDVDIVIPRMTIENRFGKWEEMKFYTDSRELRSIDCVKNSLSTWQVHGCFIIRKSIIVKSYHEYSLYNFNNENYVNNDEVITRFNFSNSRRIIKCNAVYYYHFNLNSTTKKLNDKKYLSILNAFILLDFYKYDERLKRELYSQIITVLWDISHYLNRNRKEINNKNEWVLEIKKGIKKIDFLNFFKVLSLKNKIKLCILKINFLIG